MTNARAYNSATIGKEHNINEIGLRGVHAGTNISRDYQQDRLAIADIARDA